MICSTHEAQNTFIIQPNTLFLPLFPVGGFFSLFLYLEYEFLFFLLNLHPFVSMQRVHFGTLSLFLPFSFSLFSFSLYLSILQLENMLVVFYFISSVTVYRIAIPPSVRPLNSYIAHKIHKNDRKT